MNKKYIQIWKIKSAVTFPHNKHKSWANLLSLVHTPWWGWLLLSDAYAQVTAYGPSSFCLDLEGIIGYTHYEPFSLILQPGRMPYNVYRTKDVCGKQFLACCLAELGPSCFAVKGSGLWWASCGKILSKMSLKQADLDPLFPKYCRNGTGELWSRTK